MHELNAGWKLKLVHKFNYTLDKDNEKVESALDRMSKLGNEGTFIAERIVRWKPELSIKEYRELDGEYRKIVDSVLTIKPGTPAIELVEPKVKK